MANPEPGEIEIFLSVEASVGVGFWIQRSRWEALSDDEKRKKIGEILDTAEIKLCDDVIQLQDDDRTYISAEIIGPEDIKIDLEIVNIYDPEEE